MQSLSQRTTMFTDSVIRRMTRVSLECGAVNLSQGFPDFDPPAEVLDALRAAADEPVHQYSITYGASDFRAALAEKQTRFMGRAIDPESEVTVTCGSTEAMIGAMMCVADPGDKVIVFSPFYENYRADAILAGAETLFVELTPPDFGFDPAALEAAFAQGAKALVLCNTSNPCGKVFTRSELETIADLVRTYGAYVLVDEVYEHIVYPPNVHTYFATLPDMWEHTITCGSLSKTYSITGWRLGYSIACPEITERLKKVHDFLTVGAPAPLQRAIVPALRFGQDYYDGLQRMYEAKRDYFCSGLDALGLAHTMPQGAYYVLMDIGEFGYDDDLVFCEKMAREVGVSAVPGSSFFHEPVNHLVRFNFAKRPDTLDAALNRLETLREKMGR